MSRTTDRAAMLKAERVANARRVMGAGARAVMTAATTPIETPCTEHERHVYGRTLVGITHYPSHWKRDEDGALVLVMVPRGGAIAGTVAISNQERR